MPTNAELRAELQRTPYAVLLAARNDAGLAAMLNDRAGAEAAQVQEPTLSRGEFQLAILPAVVALAATADEVQRKWDRLLAVINAADEIHVTRPDVQMLFGMAIIDGILTADQVNAVGKRPGSRAEVLWGVGTVVGVDQVSAAMNGGA